MSFVPHSSNDIKTIFNILGIDSYDDLFKHIPKDLYINEEISIEPAQSELELIQYFNSVSEKIIKVIQNFVALREEAVCLS